MILGFMLGWAAATWWWPWVLSFYEPKPLPPQEQEIVISGDTARLVQWRRNGP